MYVNIYLSVPVILEPISPNDPKKLLVFPCAQLKLIISGSNNNIGSASNAAYCCMMSLSIS